MRPTAVLPFNAPARAERRYNRSVAPASGRATPGRAPRHNGRAPLSQQGAPFSPPIAGLLP